MTNQEFWVCIKNYEHSNSNGDELICDIMVKNGLGQTVGGYYDESSPNLCVNCFRHNMQEAA